MTWFLANRLIQDSWWGVVVLDKFAEYFILPAPIFLILALFTKHRHTILVSLLPVAVGAFFYASFLSPITKNKAVENKPRFRVATFNIWNHNDDIPQVLDAIAAADADVISLQEITENQRAELETGLNATHPHYHFSKPVYGGTIALFSRIPLTNVVDVDIDVDRPAIVADLVWNEKTVTVVSAHLNPSFWAYWRQPWRKIPGNYLNYIKRQRAQVTAIITELNQRTRSRAKFLACDCNSQETASTNRLLSTKFKDTFRTIGWQLGSEAPIGFKLERKITHIDYIWFTGDVEPIGIYRSTVKTKSDHDIIIGDFVFN